jgi:hypothetical protein
VIPPEFLFLLRTSLNIWDLMYVSMNFGIFPYFFEQGHSNFDRDCITSVDHFSLYGPFDDNTSAEP